MVFSLLLPDILAKYIAAYVMGLKKRLDTMIIMYMCIVI